MLRPTVGPAAIGSSLCTIAHDNAHPFRSTIGTNLVVGSPNVETISRTRFTIRPFFAGTLYLLAGWTYCEKFGVAALGVLAIHGHVIPDTADQ
jgi:hypothetical protein